MGRIDESSTFIVKRRAYRVSDLVGDDDDARRYVGGAGCVVYLSPRDYHRVHSPVAGIIRVVRSMPGDYYPVNSIGLRHVKNLFVRNRRVAIAIDTPSLGRVTVVMVAAMVVGRITVSGIDERDVPMGTHLLDRPVAKGDEIGIFHLGSTAVVLLERGAFAEWKAPEGPTRMGVTLARAPASKKNGGGAA
jgi:phosphatidylserine decarboxylase